MATLTTLSSEVETKVEESPDKIQQKNSKNGKQSSSKQRSRKKNQWSIHIPLLLKFNSNTSNAHPTDLLTLFWKIEKCHCTL